MTAIDDIKTAAERVKAEGKQQAARRVGTR